MRLTPEPRRLLVVAPNWLGDAVMALPAIADLRRAFPSARLVVAARASVAAMFDLAPGIDEVITLEWKRQRVRDRRRVATPTSQRLREAGCDAAILLPNSFASAWLVWRARRAGALGLCGRSAVVAADARDAQARGQPAPGRLLPAPRARARRAEWPARAGVDGARCGRGRGAESLLSARGWDGRRRLVAVAPGAAYGTAKQWLPEHFVALVGELVGTDGATCVLVGGTGSDATTTAQCARGAAAARARPRDRPGRRHLAAPAGGRAVPGRCVRVERFGRDAPGRGAGRAGRGPLRADQRARDGAAGARRQARARADPAGGAAPACCASVPSITAA